MLRLNLFSFVNKNDVLRRVELLRQKHPYLDKQELSTIVVKETAKKCAALGAVTTAPATVPGVGTLISIFLGTATNILVLIHFLAFMVMEIAVINNRNLDTVGTDREAMWVLAGALGANVAARGATPSVVAGMSSEVFTGIIQRALTMLGIRVAQRTIIARIIPLLGMLFAGIINYSIAQAIGKSIIKYYTLQVQNQPDKKESPIIDAEFTDI